MKSIKNCLLIEHVAYRHRSPEGGGPGLVESARRKRSVRREMGGKTLGERLTQRKLRPSALMPQAQGRIPGRSQRIAVWVIWIALIAITLFFANVVAAATRGSSAQGRPLVSGGASFEELQALHERRADYNLWLVTAAKRSGAYLADVQVKIIDADRRSIYEGLLDGPWLFIDLAMGRYTVEATFKGQTQKAVTTIHPGDHHQVFFYFDVPDEVSPDQQRPFDGSPYGK